MRSRNLTPVFMVFLCLIITSMFWTERIEGRENWRVGNKKKIVLADEEVKTYGDVDNYFNTYCYRGEDVYEHNPRYQMGVYAVGNGVILARVGGYDQHKGEQYFPGRIGIIRGSRDDPYTDKSVISEDGIINYVSYNGKFMALSDLPKCRVSFIRKTDIVRVTYDSDEIQVVEEIFAPRSESKDVISAIIDRVVICNKGETALNNVRFSVYINPQMPDVTKQEWTGPHDVYGDHEDDSLKYNDGYLVFHDVREYCRATGFYGRQLLKTGSHLFLGVGSDRTPSAFQCHLRSSEGGAHKDDNLDDSKEAGPGDVDGALSWDIGNIKPNSRKNISINYCIRLGEENLDKEISVIKSRRADELYTNTVKWWKEWVEKGVNFGESRVGLTLEMCSIQSKALQCINGGIMDNIEEYPFCWGTGSVLIRSGHFQDAKEDIMARYTVWKKWDHFFASSWAPDYSWINAWPGTTAVAGDYGPSGELWKIIQYFRWTKDYETMRKIYPYLRALIAYQLAPPENTATMLSKNFLLKTGDLAEYAHEEKKDCEGTFLDSGMFAICCEFMDKLSKEMGIDEHFTFFDRDWTYKEIADKVRQGIRKCLFVSDSGLYAASVAEDGSPYPRSGGASLGIGGSPMYKGYADLSKEEDRIIAKKDFDLFLRTARVDDLYNDASFDLVGDSASGDYYRKPFLWAGTPGYVTLYALAIGEREVVRDLVDVLLTKYISASGVVPESYVLKDGKITEASSGGRDVILCTTDGMAGGLSDYFYGPKITMPKSLGIKGQIKGKTLKLAGISFNNGIFPQDIKVKFVITGEAKEYVTLTHNSFISKHGGDNKIILEASITKEIDKAKITGSIIACWQTDFVESEQSELIIYRK